MPADELTRAHIKAIKACLEVADPGDDLVEPTEGSPQATVALAEEGLNIILQHNPDLRYDDPLDQLTESDKNLLENYTEASNRAYWEEDQGSSFEAERKHKIFLDWQKLMVERLTR